MKKKTLTSYSEILKYLNHFKSIDDQISLSASILTKSTVDNIPHTGTYQIKSDVLDSSVKKRKW